MELSASSGAGNFSAIPKIPNIVWNPQFNFPVHNSPQVIPVLTQMNPLHTRLFR
jgi:hypothetical protein